ncbi:MAG: class I SAM-dependent methyltransferase [Acidimicrobiales bacterium]
MADHPLLAAAYDVLMAPVERAGLTERRRRLLANARGRVLEVGGGTGVNLALYRDVTSVDVLEPDAAMRRRLLRRLALSAVPVQVHEAGVTEAPFDDGSFDTVVTNLVLCTVPDLRAGLERLRRLLAPQGRLLFLEHVRGVGPRGSFQHAVAPLWSRCFGGCHPDRDVVAAIGAAGFSVTDLDRFPLPRAGPVVRPGVSGVAVPR